MSVGQTNGTKDITKANAHGRLQPPRPFAAYGQTCWYFYSFGLYATNDLMPASCSRPPRDVRTLVKESLRDQPPTGNST